MACIEAMMQKMMRRFDVTDENVKEMRNDLYDIGQKVNAHVVSLKHLEQQMTQLPTIVNPHQPGALPKNTIQNPNNEGHCMEVTTGGDKQTIDQPMPYVVVWWTYHMPPSADFSMALPLVTLGHETQQSLITDRTLGGAALSREMLSCGMLLDYGGLHILLQMLCRDSVVSIWHYDRLINPTGTLDIGLIRDEANVGAPRRDP
uniref:Integrase core domain containing protein n=1 Tax=Solanum tuberosum TaxID=4113 RepID=M1DF12_SOLTU